MRRRARRGLAGDLAPVQEASGIDRALPGWRDDRLLTGLRAVYPGRFRTIAVGYLIVSASAAFLLGWAMLRIW
jgi:hypothetical protein